MYKYKHHPLEGEEFFVDKMTLALGWKLVLPNMFNTMLGPSTPLVYQELFEAHKEENGQNNSFQFLVAIMRCTVG